ncbi:MAG: LysR family transcriptional regulator, partial [Bdellovibrionales bacterium]|nr:LysR family transcriptional regulator [Bdellovibrionales bacterium]
FCSLNKQNMVKPLSMARDLNVDQIKKLWVLDLVIQQGSLKKASLQAKVSPSAISQTLTSLESSFGKPLLIRNKGSVIPTQDALSILEVVRPAFAAFDKLKDLNGLSVPNMSWMSFGTYESIAIDFLPGFVHSLKQKLPNLRLSLRISRTANLLTMVRKGELCSALVAEVDSLDRFYVKEVASDRLGVYVSKNHRIANEGWSAIQQYGLGTLAPSKDGLPRYFAKFTKSHDLNKPTLHTDSFETLRAVASSGVIAAILPTRVADRSDDLLEITPSSLMGKNKRDVGSHKILVVSQASCDKEETDFVAAEAERILGN